MSMEQSQVTSKSISLITNQQCNEKHHYFKLKTTNTYDWSVR